MSRSPEAMPASVPSHEEGSEQRRSEKKRHLKLVTEKDEPIELTEADMLLTDAQEAQIHMDKERAAIGTAQALGREQRAIREAQAQLATEAVDELVVEQETEERDKASGFGAEKTMKAPAKKASMLDRIKGWFR